MSLINQFISRSLSVMKIPSKLIKDDKSSSSMIKSSAIVYAVSIGTLVAYNIRWKYFLPTLLGRKSRKLPIKKVQGKGDVKSISVVLLHGMWHTAEYFQQLQHILAQEGYTSYAIDMLPGERLTPGGSEKELVQDLELTLKDIKDMYVLLGHSQGGLITQACLQRSDEIRKTVAGIVLLGSYPIGLTPPFSSLAKQKQNMIMDWGYLGVCFFGKLVNARYTKGIFLLPSTDDTSEEISRYIQGILKAPSDGRVTMTHFPATPKPLNTSCLILGAAEDIIYPPHLFTKEFEKRFPKAKHVYVPDQAHCFKDPNWQTTMAKPLVKWLESQAEDNFIL